MIHPSIASYHRCAARASGQTEICTTYYVHTYTHTWTTERAGRIVSVGLRVQLLKGAHC